MYAIYHQHNQQRFRLWGHIILLLLLCTGAWSALNIGSIKDLSLRAIDNIASVVGMNAAVSPNPYNTLALQFTEKENALLAREAELTAKEASLEARLREDIAREYRVVIVALGVVTVLLLLLIFLNFYFDIRRDVEGKVSAQNSLLHNGEFRTRL